MFNSPQAKELDISTEEISRLKIINTTSGDLYFSKASKNTHLIKPFTKALKILSDKGICNKFFYKNSYMPVQTNDISNK